jgi:hypothetical protein
MGWLNIFDRPRQHQITSRKSPVASRLGFEDLESRDVPTVVYHGGALLTHVEAQAVYLGSEWSNPTVSGQPTTRTIDNSLTSLVQTSPTDSASGAYLAALTRAGYNVGTGTASPGVIDNTSLTSGATITDASIQARLSADISNGLVATPDANRLYVVYVQPNVAVDLGSGQGTTKEGILGYHGAFAGPNGTTIHYAVIAYPGGAAGNSSLGTSATDQLTAVASHEVAEAVTDPNVNFSTLGWYDSQRGEIGDVTENTAGALVRSDGFLVQLVADKNDQLLPLTATSPPASPPVASPPVSPPPVVTPPKVPPVSPPTVPPATPPSLQPSTTVLAVQPVWNPFGIPEAAVTISVSKGSVPASGKIALIVNGQVLGLANLHIVNGVAEATFYLDFYRHGFFAISSEFLGSDSLAPSRSNTVLAIA